MAPADLYNRRAAAWVFLDSIKHDSLSLVEALPYLDQLLALGLDDSERILWEQLYWQIAKMLFRLPSLPTEALLARLRTAWHSWPRLSGLAYSTMLKALLKHAAAWPDLPAWVEAWGWEHLRPADFTPETTPDGKTFPALAERTHLAVARWLHQRPADPDYMPVFLAQLDATSDAYPAMLYLLYYRALLRVKLGETEAARQLFLPFARQKQRDFWVWELMAELHPGQPDTQMGCLAKALLCRTPPEFLVKTRQKMAALLVNEGRWAEARTEIDQIVALRTTQRWRIPQEVQAWTVAPEYRAAPERTDNGPLYTQLAPLAQRLLQPVVPTVVAVVWAVNPDRQTAQFVVDAEVHGGFGFAAFGLNPSAGDLLRLGLEARHGADGQPYWKVATAETAANVDATPLLRVVEGIPRKAGAVAFVGDVLVPPDLLKDLSLAQPCRLRAVRAYNPKRKNWGWKAFGQAEPAAT